MNLRLKDIPKTHLVKPLRKNTHAKDRAMCLTCGLSWDDGITTAITPAPSARCPFEYYHHSKEG